MKQGVKKTKANHENYLKTKQAEAAMLRHNARTGKFLERYGIEN